VAGESQTDLGVKGTSTSRYGVRGSSNNADNNDAHGVVGISDGHAAGVAGENDASAGTGVYGYSANGTGVLGESSGDEPAIVAHAFGPQTPNNNSVGLYAESANNVAIIGKSSYFGISGGGDETGVIGGSSAGVGVFGSTNATHYAGVEGYGPGHAIYGHTTSAQGSGIYAENMLGGTAGYFIGDVAVTGTLSKGGGGFTIDHPQDPETKYLSHAFVESPEMLNIYSGSVTTDDSGEAVVTLPPYFEALNKDFRYQLTVQGTFAQAIIGEEIDHNRFVIRTDKPSVHVYWQVTGVRRDPFAQTSPVIVERDKTDEERGRYLYPMAYGKPREMGIRPAIQSILEARYDEVVSLIGAPLRYEARPSFQINDR
jgi:hypothetical protein